MRFIAYLALRLIDTFVNRSLPDTRIAKRPQPFPQPMESLDLVDAGDHWAVYLVYPSGERSLMAGFSDHDQAVRYMKSLKRSR